MDVAEADDGEVVVVVGASTAAMGAVAVRQNRVEPHTVNEEPVLTAYTPHEGFAEPQHN